MKNNTITHEDHAQNAENVSLVDILLKGRKLPFWERIGTFNDQIARLNGKLRHTYFRIIESKANREVIVKNDNGQKRKMLMFGSNNYLGLANHPYVIEKVKKAIDETGIGVGGPPILNGYTSGMRELEERLSALKGTEDTLIFSSGYNANLGLVSGLCKSSDIIIADEYSHASFFDGVRMTHCKCFTFRHNRADELEKLLMTYASTNGNVFVAVEGVYSMDGDLAPLNRIIPLCNKYDAVILVDDAHGTGVLGKKGGGIHDHYQISSANDIILGTFSKAFAVNGGFVSASRPVINFLRLIARSYMFSAALPPVTIAAVLAGLDVIERESHLLTRLHDNVAYAAKKLRKFGLVTEPKAGIIALKVPEGANIRILARKFHDAGMFLNAVEFPAVPVSKQRFRISIMADHTREDIDNLLGVVEELWSKIPVC